MTSELKPCPFCGSETEVCEGGINGKMRVYGLVEHKDGCFFLADGLPMKYQHIMESEFAAWNTRAERTCRVIGTHTYGEYDERKAYALSCGHNVEWNDEEPLPYCPYCGARVIGGASDD